MSVTNLPQSGAALCVTFGTVDKVHAMKPDCRERDFCLYTAPAFDALVKVKGGSPRWNITITYGMEKLYRMVWLPDGENILKMFARFERIHERDRQTDRRTPHSIAWQNICSKRIYKRFLKQTFFKIFTGTFITSVLCVCVCACAGVQ